MGVCVCSFVFFFFFLCLNSSLTLSLSLFRLSFPTITLQQTTGTFPTWHHPNKKVEPPRLSKNVNWKADENSTSEMRTQHPFEKQCVRIHDCGEYQSVDVDAAMTKTVTRTIRSCLVLCNIALDSLERSTFFLIGIFFKPAKLNRHR